MRASLPRVLGLLLAAAAAGSAQTMPGPTTDPAEFLRQVAAAPALSAAGRRVEAARERIDAAGRLPDPEIEAMGSRMRGPMDERATMWELNLRQPLPKRGERAADRERAQAAAAMSQADFALMLGEMAADVAMALAEADGARARIALLETQLGRLDSVLRTLEVQLSTGSGGRLADRLTVQSRVASLQLMIAEARRMAADAEAEARGRLGLAPDAALPGWAVPSAAEVDANRAADMQLVAARTDEANAMLKMARASARPMTAIGLRLERERNAMGDEDTVGLAFMSEIPWRARRYARAESRAAEAERAAAQWDGSAVRYRIASAVTRVERAERLAETARELNRETLERLNAELDALVRGASVAGMGESTIFQTVEILEKATDAELQVVEAETAAQTARAELWRYTALPPFLEPSP